MNWIPITNISEIPTNTRVLLTVQSLKFEKLDVVMSATITEENGKRTVRFHTSDVVMYDISKDMIDHDGEYVDTLIITAYMNYPEPYKPKNNETDEQDNLITAINNGRILSTGETSEIADRIVKSYFVHRCDTDEHGFCRNSYKYNSERIIRNISHESAVSIKRKLQHRINEYKFLFYSVPYATLHYENDTNDAYFDFTCHLFNCSLEMVRLLTK